MRSLGLCALVLAGCYAVSAPDDAGRDAALPFDANVLLASCATATGAVRCRSEGCPPSICSTCFPVDFMGTLLPPDEPGPAYCLSGVDFEPAGGLSGCSIANSGCQTGEFCGLRPNSAGDGGWCVVPEVCAQYLADGNPNWRCIYEDETPYATGHVPRSPCPESVRGVACGTGCGECGATETCFGPSEESGVGVCLPRRRDVFVDRQPCGTMGGETMACDGGTRCLRFATTAPSVFGSCVAPTVCSQLAAAMPERFVCDL